VISRLENGRPIGLRLVTLMRLFDALGIEALEARLRPWHPWSDRTGVADPDETELPLGDPDRLPRFEDRITLGWPRSRPPAHTRTANRARPGHSADVHTGRES